VRLLNRAAAQMLSRDRERTLGTPIESLWPELASLVTAGEPVDELPVRLGGRGVLGTLRRLSDGGQDDVDVVGLAGRNPPEARPRRAPSPAAFDLVGESAPLRQARELARVAAQSDSNLLIEGESGVGKELLAQAIHAGGPRRRGPFIAISCAAIPRD